MAMHHRKHQDVPNNPFARGGSRGLSYTSDPRYGPQTARYHGKRSMLTKVIIVVGTLLFAYFTLSWTSGPAAPPPKSRLSDLETKIKNEERNKSDFKTQKSNLRGKDLSEKLGTKSAMTPDGTAISSEDGPKKADTLPYHAASKDEDEEMPDLPSEEEEDGNHIKDSQEDATGEDHEAETGVDSVKDSGDGNGADHEAETGVDSVKDSGDEASTGVASKKHLGDGTGEDHEPEPEEPATGADTEKNSGDGTGEDGEAEPEEHHEPPGGVDSEEQSGDGTGHKAGGDEVSEPAPNQDRTKGEEKKGSDEDETEPGQEEDKQEGAEEQDSEPKGSDEEGAEPATGEEEEEEGAKEPKESDEEGAEPAADQEDEQEGAEDEPKESDEEGAEPATRQEEEQGGAEEPKGSDEEGAEPATGEEEEEEGAEERKESDEEGAEPAADQEDEQEDAEEPKESDEEGAEPEAADQDGSGNESAEEQTGRSKVDSPKKDEPAEGESAEHQEEGTAETSADEKQDGTGVDASTGDEKPDSADSDKAIAGRPNVFNVDAEVEVLRKDKVVMGTAAAKKGKKESFGKDGEPSIAKRKISGGGDVDPVAGKEESLEDVAVDSRTAADANKTQSELNSTLTLGVEQDSAYTSTLKRDGQIGENTTAFNATGDKEGESLVAGAGETSVGSLNKTEEAAQDAGKGTLTAASKLAEVVEKNETTDDSSKDSNKPTPMNLTESTEESKNATLLTKLSEAEPSVESAVDRVELNNETMMASGDADNATALKHPENESSTLLGSKDEEPVGETTVSGSETKKGSSTKVASTSNTKLKDSTLKKDSSLPAKTNAALQLEDAAATKTLTTSTANKKKTKKKTKRVSHYDKDTKDKAEEKLTKSTSTARIATVVGDKKSSEKLVKTEDGEMKKSLLRKSEPQDTKQSTTTKKKIKKKHDDDHHDDKTSTKRKTMTGITGTKIKSSNKADATKVKSKTTSQVKTSSTTKKVRKQVENE